MTPELAIRLVAQAVPEELDRQMHQIYQTYSVEEIAAAIAKIRAEKILAEIDAETLNILYENSRKPTKNVNQGPEK